MFRMFLTLLVLTISALAPADTIYSTDFPSSGWSWGAYWFGQPSSMQFLYYNLMSASGGNYCWYKDSLVSPDITATSGYEYITVTFNHNCEQSVYLSGNSDVVSHCTYTLSLNQNTLWEEDW